MTVVKAYYLNGQYFLEGSESLATHQANLSSLPAIQAVVESEQISFFHLSHKNKQPITRCLEIHSELEYQAMAMLSAACFSKDEIKDHKAYINLFKWLWSAQCLYKKFWQFVHSTPSVYQDLNQLYLLGEQHTDTLQWLSHLPSETLQTKAASGLRFLAEKNILNEKNSLVGKLNRYLLFEISEARLPYAICILSALTDQKILDDELLAIIHRAKSQQQIEDIYQKTFKLLQLGLLTKNNLLQAINIELSDEFEAYLTHEIKNNQFESIKAAYQNYLYKTYSPAHIKLLLQHNLDMPELTKLLTDKPNALVLAQDIIDVSNNLAGSLKPRLISLAIKLEELQLLDDYLVKIKHSPALLETLVILDENKQLTTALVDWAISHPCLNYLPRLLTILDKHKYLDLDYIETFDAVLQRLLIFNKRHQGINYIETLLITLENLSELKELNIGTLDKLLAKPDLVYYLNSISFFIKADFITPEVFLFLNSINLLAEFCWLLHIMAEYQCASKPYFTMIFSVENLISLYATVACLANAELLSKEAINFLLTSPSLPQLSSILELLQKKDLLTATRWQLINTHNASDLLGIIYWLSNSDALLINHLDNILLQPSLEQLATSLPKEMAIEERETYLTTLLTESSAAIESEPKATSTVTKPKFSSLRAAIKFLENWNTNEPPKFDITDEELSDTASPKALSLSLLRSCSSYQRFSSTTSSPPSTLHLSDNTMTFFSPAKSEYSATNQTLSPSALSVSVGSTSTA